MKKLGKISISPKGDWNEETLYTRLDLVSHNNSSWVCKKDCKGVAPSKGEFWQLIATGGSGGGESVSITVDSVMSDISTNPVQNKVINEAIKKKAEKLKLDGNKLSLLNALGENLSFITLPSSSGGGGGTVTNPSDLTLLWSGTQEEYDAIEDKSILEGMFVNIKDGAIMTPTETPITVDDILDAESENPVMNKVITEAINEIKASLENNQIVVDSELDEESENPVSNKAIVDYFLNETKIDILKGYNPNIFNWAPKYMFLYFDDVEEEGDGKSDKTPLNIAQLENLIANLPYDLQGCRLVFYPVKSFDKVINLSYLHHKNGCLSIGSLSKRIYINGVTNIYGTNFNLMFEYVSLKNGLTIGYSSDSSTDKTVSSLYVYLNECTIRPEDDSSAMLFIHENATVIMEGFSNTIAGDKSTWSANYTYGIYNRGIIRSGGPNNCSLIVSDCNTGICCSGGIITANSYTFTGTSVNYLIKNGGRIFAGAQANVPNY